MIIRWLTLYAQLCTVGAAVLVWLANSYEVIGQGLHPWVALPLATLFMFIPYVLNNLLVEIDKPDELSTIHLRNPNTDYAALEREYLGDPDKKTGIYSPESAARRKKYHPNTVIS